MLAGIELADPDLSARVASGIRGPDGALVGIIGVTGRTSGMRADRLTRPVLAAASEATRAYRQEGQLG